MSSEAHTQPPSGAAGTRPPRRGLRRGAYILPSLFTMGNILAGFYAVVLGFRGDDGNFFVAAWVLVIAGVFDGLDGRIARLTHTESAFGKEFDSLADVLTFGAAPAYLAFVWGLHQDGRIGWLVPVFFLLCTAVRLARFNVQAKTQDSRAFVGLPSPGAAGLICCLFFLSHQLDARDAPWMRAIFLAGLLLGGSLMVSTFRYPSLKRLDLRRKFSYRAAMSFAVVLLLATFHPTLFFEIMMAVYVASGPVHWIWSRSRRRVPDNQASVTAAASKPSVDAETSDTPALESEPAE